MSVAFPAGKATDRPPTPLAVGALILAAGAGSRAAPDNKLLARDAAGRSMIGRTVLLVAEAFPPGNRLLVLGHDAVRVAAAARDAVPDQQTVLARRHREGMAASLRCGVRRARRAGWSAVLVLLGDMPLLAPATLAAVLAAHAATHAGAAEPDVVFPVRNGRRGHPVLWRRALFPRLLALRGDNGARILLDAPGLRSLPVPTDDDGAFADFDTPARLAAFRASGIG